uniref:Uncharacterized protein n=1 Tax=Anguilla anguilla TaxID=7936 RepID=A0A0E9PRI5_ANGAN
MGYRRFQEAVSYPRRSPQWKNLIVPPSSFQEKSLTSFVGQI